VAVPAGWFVAQYIAAIAKGAGEDTYKAFKSALVNRMREDRAHTVNHLIRFHKSDTPSAPIILMTPGLPEEAFEALVAVDWSGRPPGTYQFDSSTGDWSIKP